MTTALFRVETSLAELPAGSALKRLPRAPSRVRPESFMERFEDRILYYDCFRHHENNDVLLVGPPPFNLEPELRAAHFSADGTDVAAEHHISRSTLLTRLSDMPATASSIHFTFGDQTFSLPIQPNLSDRFAGRNVLLTMSKNNDEVWIKDWIAWYREVHQADSLIFFDNGSDAYSPAELENILGGCGLSAVALVTWPYRYGARDPKVLNKPYWAHFLQVSALNIMLRRLGRTAHALLNCDIDELVAPVEGGTVFDLPEQSPYGLASLSGEWVSAATSDGVKGYRHRDYVHLARGFGRKLCPRKWVLDPSQNWLDDYEVFPYVHRVFNTPNKSETQKAKGRFWHLGAVSTNWKQTRRKPVRANVLTHSPDAQLKALAQRVWPN